CVLSRWKHYDSTVGATPPGKMTNMIQCHLGYCEAMKKLCLSLACMTATVLSVRAADVLYHNIGTVNCGDTPQVDATAFLNDGSFCTETAPGGLFGDNFAIPYTTQDTLSFTNNGLMQSVSRFQLDYINADGFHHQALN